MSRLMKIIYKCHKWFGIPLSLLFLMWYCSGIIMMYHDFPRLSSSDRPVELLDTAALQSLWNELPDSIKTCRMTYSGRRLQIIADGETYGAYRPDRHDLKMIANSFGASVEKVDTVEQLDTWTPFSNLSGHLPFYKIIGDDESFIYVSSQTGEIVQRNTLAGRRWAWFGALPHYVYITPLRKNADLWRNVVGAVAGACTVSVLFGLVIAIRLLIKKRKLTLFKKKSWELHYISGIIFGVFMLAFIFSGMMSLVKIPDWILRSESISPTSPSKVAKKEIDLALLPGRFGEVSLRMNPFPFWLISDGINSETSGIGGDKVLDFSPSAIIPIIRRQTGEQVTEVRPVSNDIYYSSRAGEGYLAKTEKFSIYWNNDGYYRIYDRKAKVQHICYRFLHTMRIPGLYENRIAHSVFMWIVLIGGLVIVGTGTVLSVRSVMIRQPQK